MSLEPLPPESGENQLVLADNSFQAAVTPDDFTMEYDQAVDLLEDHWIGSALQALSAFDIDAARTALAQARVVRTRYIELLELSEAQQDHPLAENFPSLSDYAVSMAELRENLDSVLRAFTEYRQGNSKAATGILDSLNPSHSQVVESDANSVLACNLAAASESLAGEIRVGSLDYVGACAAFYGAVSVAENGLAITASLADEIGEEDAAFLARSFETLRTQNTARAQQMEYQMALQQGDLRGAIESAHGAAESLTKTVELLGPAPVFAPLFLAYSFEAAAGEYEARASLALEAGQWDEAAELSREVSKKYLAASEACLKCSHEIGGSLQLRYLNTRVAWSTRFARQLARERELQSKLDDAQAKFDTLFESVRGALKPMGLTLNNNNVNDIDTVVKQQVEVTNRIEVNIKNMLRDVPKALADADIPDEDKAQLSEEALRLADDPDTGPTFFEKVKKFAARLADVTSKVATVAGPILALAQALAVVV